MNTSEYIVKANNILSDSKTNKLLPRDPTNKYMDIVVKKLKELKEKGAISELDYKRLYPTSTLVPGFYGLPQVHKQGSPLRPIVASRGSITYSVAKRVADILAPLVGKNGYALQNSADLVKQMADLVLDDDDSFV